MGHVNSHGIAPNLFKKLPYDAERDFSMVAYVGYVPNVLVIHPSVPAQNVKELIAIAKSKPGTLNYASSGVGSTQHLAGELFTLLAGVKIVHVPYKGSGPAVIDLTGGNVQLMFDAPPALYGQIKAGRLRVLASAYSKRSELFPEVPTLAEAGYPGLEGVIWYGVSGPAGLVPGVVSRLNVELHKLLASAEVKERFAQQGAVPTPMSAQHYTAFIAAEMAKWAPVVRSSGAKVD
jgi:tripartite-type tricarboxylate transporter receptor subunit TctC